MNPSHTQLPRWGLPSAFEQNNPLHHHRSTGSRCCLPTLWDNLGMKAKLPVIPSVSTIFISDRESNALLLKFLNWWEMYTLDLRSYQNSVPPLNNLVRQQHQPTSCMQVAGMECGWYHCHIQAGCKFFFFFFFFLYSLNPAFTNRHGRGGWL